MGKIRETVPETGWGDRICEEMNIHRNIHFLIEGNRGKKRKRLWKKQTVIVMERRIV